MKRIVAVALVIVLALNVPALAIFGIGDIVFDPTNFEEAVQEFAELEQQYMQLVQTYQMIQNQYNQMIWMAKTAPVNMLLRYHATATPWTPSSATNTYGTTAAWESAINSGQNVSNGYSTSTEALGSYGGALGNIPEDQLERLEKDYGTVELSDGANQAAMQLLGQLRANAAANETTISNLENDSLSSDPDMNTEIAVLNKISAAGIVNLRNTQDANKLLAALAEAQIVAAKRERDAEARAFNEHIQFMSQGQEALSSQAANASSAMLAWHMP
jgi:type IV secretion system protein TrbJ